MAGAGKKIRDAVMSWPDVEEGPHPFGATEYRLGERQIGHVHGDYLVDIPFPKAVRDELVRTARAQPHHINPDSGWVSFFIRAEGDVEAAIELLRLSYQRAASQRSRRQSA